MGRNQGYWDQMCYHFIDGSLDTKHCAANHCWIWGLSCSDSFPACLYDLILSFLFIGSLCSDVEFSVETDYSQETRRSSAVQQDIKSEWSHAVEQTLTVFVFTQYTDPFRSQISDFLSESRLLFPII